MPVSAAAEFLLLRRLGTERRQWLDHLLKDPSVTLSAIGPECLPHIERAAVEYGKGSGHPAQLNFGDCLSYAFARAGGFHLLFAPLLFIGDDFRHTDVTPAL